MSIRSSMLLTLFATLALAACAARPEMPANPPQAAPLTIKEDSTVMPANDPTPVNAPLSSQDGQTPDPGAASVQPDPLLKKFTDMAVKDLASRLKMEAASIEILSADAIVWPNSALGCPKPDMMYAQGTVPGFRIKLSSAGKEYVYNTDRTGTIVLCPQAGEGDVEGPSMPVNPNDTLGGQIK